VKAGDPLVDGPQIPHDILRISGEEATQQYLRREIQGVYRSQNVTIDDEHIEIITRSAACRRASSTRARRQRAGTSRIAGATPRAGASAARIGSIHQVAIQTMASVARPACVNGRSAPFAST